MVAVVCLLVILVLAVIACAIGQRQQLAFLRAFAGARDAQMRQFCEDALARLESIAWSGPPAAVADPEPPPAPGAFSTPLPRLNAHIGHVQVERLHENGEWVPHHWVREGSGLAQEAIDRPGLRLKYYTGRIEEGNQE